MSEVKELSTDLIDIKSTSPLNEIDIDYKKIPVKEIAQRLEQQADEAAVLEDGSIRLVDRNFAEQVVNKKYTHLSETFTPKFIIAAGGIGIPSMILGIMANDSLNGAGTPVGIAIGFGFPLLGAIVETLNGMRKTKHANKMFSKTTTQKIQPKLIKWMDDEYDIKISNDIAQLLAKNALRDYYTDFTAEDGKNYRFTANSQTGKEGWFVQEAKVQPKVETHSMLPSKKDHITVPSITSVEEVNEIRAALPEHETFINKVFLLEQQVLSAEHKHILDRAKQDTSSILSSAALLKKLGDTTHEDSIKEAFMVLNQELDNILTEMLNHQRNELALKKQLITERVVKPLTLTKQLD